MQRLNMGYLLAGGLLLATAGIHALIGGPEINAPVQGSALDPVVRAVSAVVWHALTALFLVFGGALIVAARGGGRVLAAAVLVLCLAFAGLFVGIGMVALGSVWPMPQWTLFTVIAAAVLWGLRIDRARAWDAGQVAQGVGGPLTSP